MSEKIMNEKQGESSSTAVVDAKQQQTKTPETSDISGLKAELENLKDMLKAIESRAKTDSSTQQASKPQLQEKLRATINADFAKIDALVSSGKLSQIQGTSLKNYVLKKAFGNVDSTKPAQQKASDAAPGQDSFSEFDKSNPDFFNSDARSLVKNYIKSALENVSTDELQEIASLVVELENAAVQSYRQSQSLEKSLESSNEQAKKRLASAAMAGNQPSGALPQVFTREQIGKMSTDEFRKNEAAIMQQLRSGLIR